MFCSVSRHSLSVLSEIGIEARYHGGCFATTINGMNSRFSGVVNAQRALWLGCILALMLVVMPCRVQAQSTAAPAAAESTDQTEQEPMGPPDMRPEDVVAMSCQLEDYVGDSWLDRTHAYLNRQLCGPAAWFDGFFGSQRADEETPVGSFFRIRNSLRWDESENLDFNVKFSANIYLPRVSQRVRLLISRDDDQAGLDDQADSSNADEDLETRLGLRFLLNESGRTQFDLDGTVRVKTDGLNPRIRGRARNALRLSENSFARFTQTGFWEREDGFGVSSRADLEWLPDDETLVRLTGTGTVSEATDGIDWRTGLIGFRQLNRKTAVRSELGAFRRTDGSRKREEVFVNFRFRRAFLRDWLFYELQPEYAWPVDPETGDRGSDWRFILTLEIQFENKAHRELRVEEQGLEDGEEPIDHYRGR